jgi:hypothetical protein
MFKILVNGVEHGRYTDTCGCVTVGSAENADVYLPSAATEHIKIYPLHGSYGGCFKVTVHARDGMTHHTKEWGGVWKTVQWTPDPPYWLKATSRMNLVTFHGDKPPGWVLVHGGDEMIIGKHKIEVINC